MGNPGPAGEQRGILEKLRVNTSVWISALHKRRLLETHFEAIGPALCIVRVVKGCSSRGGAWLQPVRRSQSSTLVLR